MMKFLVAAALVLLAAAAATAEMASFEGYKVLRIEYSLSKAPWVRTTVDALDLDVWSDSSRGMDVMVGPAYTQLLINRLTSKGIRSTVLIDDVQKLVDEQTASSGGTQPKAGAVVDNSKYRDFATLEAEIDELERAYPEVVSTSVAAQTYEGRGIRIVKLSSDRTNTHPVVWIDCGVHAREWVSVTTCMYMMDQLASQYGTDAGVTSLLNTYDFHFLPVANPDGYVFSWEHNRFWRKNRTPYGRCFGADPNRNFDSNFGGSGSSDVACSGSYHGPSAFSEQESATIRDLTIGLGDRLAAFFTLHCFSQFWITPYGYTYALPADYTEMMRVTEIGVTALTAVHGTEFVYGNIADVVYLASGGSTDWLYDSTGIPYAFALELRDQGEYGFLLPEIQIVPTGEETLAGIVAAVNAIPL